MGLTIISKKDGSGVTVSEFKHKIKLAKHLLEEICEDTESMVEEFGPEIYRDNYAERSRYRDDYERYAERRR